MDSLTLAASVLLGGVFGFAAVSKLVTAGDRDVSALLELTGFARGGSARALSVALPAVELAVPVLLVLPATRTAGLVLAATLLLGFAVALGIALRRDVRVTCACFGSKRTAIAPLHVIRNVALAAVALACLAIRDGAPADGPTLTVTVAVALLAVTLVVVLDDVIPALTEPHQSLGRSHS